MKKLLVIWFILLFIVGCQEIKNNKGFIVAKGIDKIDIEAMMTGLSITVTEADSKYQEMFWIKIRGHEGKIFVNQFCYEDSEVGQIISLGEENMDNRFSQEY